MKSLYKNITDSEYETLSWFLTNDNRTPADYFFTNPTVDGHIEELEKNGLVRLNEKGTVAVTELGRAALKEYDHILEAEKSERRFRQIQFWVPVAISLVALAVSIIALAK